MTKWRWSKRGVQLPPLPPPPPLPQIRHWGLFSRQSCWWLWWSKYPSWKVHRRQYPTSRHRQSKLISSRMKRRCGIVGEDYNNAQIAYATKFLILLRKSNPKTRSEYWIPGQRSFTRKISYLCVTYRRFEGLPFNTPPQPPLPECRVMEDPAFSYTGVNFPGPLFVQKGTRQFANPLRSR